MLTLCAFVQIRARDGLQSMFPFIAAGAGMVGTGLLLDHAASWELFTSTPETFILVPALLGLKGNLEMTLASRLSTMVSMLITWQQIFDHAREFFVSALTMSLD
ncbi:unnamed protein product [Anisakis simplex]|uniref:Na_H_Exchanger domain-containing protein n=1 Tax=Anisakis simplex TaxID=6269 RepID=A0A0M3JMK1_ANISI|nr:unnamed protein product [Anisakis simplex]